MSANDNASLAGEALPDTIGDRTGYPRSTLAVHLPASTNKKQLRPQQIQLLTDIDQTLKAGCRRLMVQAPTGYGKTLVAAMLAGTALSNGQRMIFAVPALSLVDQTVEKFRAEGIEDIGVIQADHVLTNPAACIQIASTATLARRTIPSADLVLIDECHRWYDFYGDWLSDPAWANVPFIGLSATPWTRGLSKYFHKLIIAATTAELIDAGYLSRFRVFAPSSPDLDGVRTVAGDYHEADLSAAPKKCERCSFLMSPKLLSCPACGWAPTPKCTAMPREGELVELRAQPRSATISAAAQERANWQGMLTWIAEEKGYKLGWIGANYKKKFGVWPPQRTVSPIEPTREVRDWVRAQQRAYASSMRSAS